MTKLLREGSCLSGGIAVEPAVTLQTHPCLSLRLVTQAQPPLRQLQHENGDLTIGNGGPTYFTRLTTKLVTKANKPRWFPLEILF